MAEEEAAQALSPHLEKVGNRAARSMGGAGGNGDRELSVRPQNFETVRKTGNSFQLFIN